MTERIIASGMAGFCLKSHYFCTAERAALMNLHAPACHTIGSLTLGSSIGGFNPVAVELAARAGARIIWMPTCDSAYERDQVFNVHKGEQHKHPLWAKIVIGLEETGVHCPTYSLLENGKLKDEIYDILTIASKHNLVIATGHISHEETFALARAVKEMHFPKLLITHVTFPTTFYTVEQQRELIACGAYVEHCYTTYATNKIDFGTIAAQIKAVGPERVIISTDSGRPSGSYPDEDLLSFSASLLEAGFTEAEIHTMNRDIPKMLIAQ
jgi:hypothetical protein